MDKKVEGTSTEGYEFHFREGWRLTGDQLLIQNKQPFLPLWMAKGRIRRALVHFEQAARINPDAWEAMWAIGKIHQRLGDHTRADEWLSRAYRLNPEQVDVAREAGLEALQVRNTERAITYLKAAARLSPNDPGHVANLALAQLLGGLVDDAHNSITAAVRQNPSDPVSRRLLRAIEKVHEGKAPIPVSVTEVEKLGK